MFKVTFQTTTSTIITVADDAGNPPIRGRLEKLGGQGVTEKVSLYNSPFSGLFPRGNVSGQFIVSTTCSYPNLTNLTAAWTGFYTAINKQGTAILYLGTATYTMANAVLASVERVDLKGVRLDLRFTFEITTIT